MEVPDILTPADVYLGRGAKVLKMREEIKKLNRPGFTGE